MDEGVFLGYSNSRKAYNVFNKRTLVVEGYMHVTFDESSKLDLVKDSVSCDEIVGNLEKLDIRGDATQNKEELNKDNQTQEQHALEEIRDDIAYVDHQEVHGDLSKEWRFTKDHLKYNIIGEASKGVSTWNQLKTLGNLAFLSQIEPRIIEEAINDESWVLAMQEELNQFEKNRV